MKLKKYISLGLLAVGALSLASCDTNTPQANAEKVVDNDVNTGSENTNNNNTNTENNNTTEQKTDNQGNQVTDNTIVDNNTDIDVTGNKLPTITNSENKLNITLCNGDQESLYAEFNPVTDATSYNVYVKGGQYANFTKMDEQLVRLYKKDNKQYYRADVVGLKKGAYELKIVPVISGNEVESKGNTVSDINVISYDRTGFAFSSISELKGEAPGAYKMDGTLKDNAQVIYLTESNKKTVKATIGGVSCTGIAEITQNLKTKKTTNPVAIRVIGKVTIQDTICNDLNKWYCMGIKQGSNLTIEGIGNDATMYGGGVGCNDSVSVEFRNLGFIEWGSLNADSDAIAMQGSRNVWVHDNDIFYGHKQSGDQAKGDGSCDLKDDSQYVTIAYNHFWDSGKMSLCGMKSESGENYISYHHNWFDHSDSRHPRIRTMTVHVYNNYYDGVSKYGVGAVKGAQCFAEGNYFRNCKDPFLVGGFGTDGAASKSTFSGETAGFIKAYNNHIEGATSLMYANAEAGVAGSTKAGTATNSDAYLASTRDEVIGNSYTNGVAYSNFDTKVDLGVEASHIQSPEKAKETIMSYAGRTQGGDVSYQFDNSTADTSYDIDTTLANLVIGYKSNVEYIFGIEGESAGNTNTENTNTENQENTENQGNTGTTPISGAQSISFSDQKVTQTGGFEASVSSFRKASDIGLENGYALNGVTYNSAAKVDSSASIKFTLASDSKITIYMACKAKGNKLNVGTELITTTDTVPTKYELYLKSGSYDIKKNSGELYIFLIVIE